MAEDCKCNICAGACLTKPGWLMPGQAEKIAEHLGVTLKELFDTKLMIDWYEEDHLVEDETFVLAPALVGESPGNEYPAEPRGQCIFYDDGLCSIHEVKPFECKEYHHSQDSNETRKRHAGVALAWTSNQRQITELLGREPESEYYSGGLFGSMFGW